MEKQWEIISTGWETALYRGPQEEAEFGVSPAVYGGELRRRGGKIVLSIWTGSVRWVGNRRHQAMSEADRDRILTAIGVHNRTNDQPYEFILPSGEIEDERGERTPGFRSALPYAEHSDGWSLEDLWLSRAYPDAAEFPPTIVYRDATGTAEMPRSIEIADGVRRRVIDGNAIHWIGDRTGEPVDGRDRDRILARVHLAYDRWGEAYRMA
jgi:hypothetical protein